MRQKSFDEKRHIPVKHSFLIPEIPKDPPHKVFLQGFRKLFVIPHSMVHQNCRT